MELISTSSASIRIPARSSSSSSRAFHNLQPPLVRLSGWRVIRERETRKTNEVRGSARRWRVIGSQRPRERSADEGQHEYERLLRVTAGVALTTSRYNAELLSVEFPLVENVVSEDQHSEEGGDCEEHKFHGNDCEAN